MKNNFKGHPLMILSFLKPYLFVLVIPVIKGAVQFLLTRRISGVLSFEIYLFSAILLLAAARWLSFSVTLKNDVITVSRGLIFKTKAKININKLSSIVKSVNPLQSALKAVSFCLNTEAGNINESDFKFILGKNSAEKLSVAVYGEAGNDIIRYSNPKIALFSVSSSSALTGIIIAAPVINRAGKLLNIAITEMILDEIDSFSNRFMRYFPPAVTALTVILLTAYGISFLIAFCKNITFRLNLDKERTEIISGLITKKRTVFSKKCLNDLMIVQTPIMRFVKKYSLYASVGGYGNSKSEKAVIIPCGNHHEMKQQFKAFYPDFADEKPFLSAEKNEKSYKRFMWLPKLYGILIAAGAIALMVLFRHFDRFVLFLASIGGLIDLYYADLCKCNYNKGKVSLSEIIRARGSKGFKFCEMYCEREKVGDIKITETPADRKLGTCKVKLIVRSESADNLKVRNLEKASLLKEIGENYGIKGF